MLRQPGVSQSGLNCRQGGLHAAHGEAPLRSQPSFIPPLAYARIANDSLNLSSQIIGSQRALEAEQRMRWRGDGYEIHVAKKLPEETTGNTCGDHQVRAAINDRLLRARQHGVGEQ